MNVLRKFKIFFDFFVLFSSLDVGLQSVGI